MANLILVFKLQERPIILGLRKPRGRPRRSAAEKSSVNATAPSTYNRRARGKSVRPKLRKRILPLRDCNKHKVPKKI
jgi:hypothetical protein